MKKKFYKTADKSKYLIIVIFLAAILASMAYAASNFFRVNSGGGEIIINVFGVCKKVTRTAAGDIFIPTKTDAEWQAFRNNATGVTLTNCAAPCPGVPSVTYGGQTYDTVQIGSQCWMKQNLNIGSRVNGNQFNNGVIEKFCYDNLDVNCWNGTTGDGGLYFWDEAMGYTIIEGSQGICPTGWHIPRDSEWYTLENYLKNSGQSCSSTRNNNWDCATAGTKLKTGGTSGFEGVLAGYRNNGLFYNRGAYAAFWSSTASGPQSKWYRLLNLDNSTVRRSGNNSLEGFSVRCLKN